LRFANDSSKVLEWFPIYTPAIGSSPSSKWWIVFHLTLCLLYCSLLHKLPRLWQTTGV
jgi:hypothetical protein